MFLSKLNIINALSPTKEDYIVVLLRLNIIYEENCAKIGFRKQDGSKLQLSRTSLCGLIWTRVQDKH